MHFRSLFCLVLIHTLVDGYAQVVSPLWPHLKRTLGLDPWLLTVMIASWQISTSVSQPLFGYWGDRFGSRCACSASRAATATLSRWMPPRKTKMPTTPRIIASKIHRRSQ